MEPADSAWHRRSWGVGRLRRTVQVGDSEKASWFTVTVKDGAENQMWNNPGDV